jgi:hypothetical protein
MLHRLHGIRFPGVTAGNLLVTNAIQLKEAHNKATEGSHLGERQPLLQCAIGAELYYHAKSYFPFNASDAASRP